MAQVRQLIIAMIIRVDMSGEIGVIVRCISLDNLSRLGARRLVVTLLVYRIVPSIDHCAEPNNLLRGRLYRIDRPGHPTVLLHRACRLDLL